jgi:hypothetical protein
MSRKDYTAFAEALGGKRPAGAGTFDRECQWTQDVLAVAHVFADDNPSFNPHKFCGDCGMDPEIWDLEMAR